MNNLIYKDECYKIVGACMDVHNELGCGFLEPVYQESLELMFKELSIPYEREKELNLYFKGQRLNKTYFADFVCYNKIIIELKALSRLTGEHESQILNYLKITGFNLGLLINFGESSLHYKRFVV